MARTRAVTKKLEAVTVDEQAVAARNEAMGNLQRLLELIMKKVYSMNEYVDQQKIISNIVQTLSHEYQKSKNEMHRLGVASQTSADKTDLIHTMLVHDNRWVYLYVVLGLLVLFLSFNLWKIYRTEKLHSL